MPSFITSPACSARNQGRCGGACLRPRFRDHNAPVDPLPRLKADRESLCRPLARNGNSCSGCSRSAALSPAALSCTGSVSGLVALTMTCCILKIADALPSPQLTSGNASATGTRTSCGRCSAGRAVTPVQSFRPPWGNWLVPASLFWVPEDARSEPPRRLFLISLGVASTIAPRACPLKNWLIGVSSLVSRFAD
jgi:hypothetical protein